MPRRLSGLGVEYVILEIFSRDSGQRAAEIGFNVGPGSQDVGFRNDISIVFTAQPTRPIVFPQDRGQTVVGRHERKSANGRRHVFVSHCTLLVPRCIGSVDVSDGLKITPVPRHCSPFSDTCPPRMTWPKMASVPEPVTVS